MPDLSKIYAKDDALFDVLQELSMSEALQCFNKNNFLKTGQVMTSFVAKTNFLKTAIFDLCESDNLYSANVIFRSLIEHVLKAQYVFMKWAEDKNDSVGENYLHWYEAAEQYNYLKSWEAVSKLANDGQAKGNPEEILFGIRPELSGKSIKEIKSISSQFTYRSIITYMNENVPNHSKSAEKSFLLKIIPNYADLSGYVHGGPTANKELMTIFTNESERASKLEDIAELTVLMVGSINSCLLLMLMNLDSSFEKLFVKLRNTL